MSNPAMRLAALMGAGMSLLFPSLAHSESDIAHTIEALLHQGIEVAGTGDSKQSIQFLTLAEANALRNEVVARVEAGERRTLELDLPPEADAVRDPLPQ